VWPQSYLTHIRLFHRKIISAVKQSSPHMKVLFHTCGAIRPIIPDLIDIGVNTLIPVQVRALGMAPLQLKRDCGRELSSWGGGVDTQRVLGSGTPQQNRDDVRRNTDAPAPGGGFVFSTVHIVQPNVPPGHCITMWEEFRNYGFRVDA
jgi:uroporphyrinogen decarboxylase